MPRTPTFSMILPHKRQIRKPYICLQPSTLHYSHQIIYFIFTHYITEHSVSTIIILYLLSVCATSSPTSHRLRTFFIYGTTTTSFPMCCVLEFIEVRDDVFHVWIIPKGRRHCLLVPIFTGHETIINQPNHLCFQISSNLATHLLQFGPLMLILSSAHNILYIPTHSMSRTT